MIWNWLLCLLAGHEWSLVWNAFNNVDHLTCYTCGRKKKYSG